MMDRASHEDWEFHSLVRAVRQQLESLGRAGLDRVPAPAHGSVRWIERRTVVPGRAVAVARPAVASGTVKVPHDDNEIVATRVPAAEAVVYRRLRAASPSQLRGPRTRRPLLSCQFLPWPRYLRRPDLTSRRHRPVTGRRSLGAGPRGGCVSPV